MKTDAGVRTSLLTIYSFAIFIFLYVMAVHDYVNDFQMPHLIPLYMCLVFYPMLIVDTPGRKFIFQVILSVILFLALFYFFDLDPHLAVLTIANVIILASTSYLSACVLLYQRLETYTALKRANYMSRHDMATGLRNRTTFFDDYAKMAQEGIMPITVSVGCAGYEKNDFAERLIARADEKMYENKQVSKNLNK